MKMCPTADDIWFWAMAVLNGTKINIINNKKFKLNFVEGTQEKDCLEIINVGNNRNDIQLKNVFEYYPQILKKLDKKNIRNPYKPTFMQKIFSVRMECSNHKQYWVIRICGLKFAIKKKNIL